MLKPLYARNINKIYQVVVRLGDDKYTLFQVPRFLVRPRLRNAVFHTQLLVLEY
jgi:hypothetical protein